MAHELEIKDGVASTFSVRETPWHREGHILAEAPSLDEALRLARMDYPVRKLPVTITLPTPDGDTYEVESSKAFVTVRMDTNRELGSVGPDYQPVQNADAFRVLEPLLDKGLVTLETGGVLREGADAWLLAKWDLAKFGPITREVFNGEVEPYALLALNHSGRRGILVKKTNIRVVCANTLGFAETGRGDQIIVVHSGDALTKLIEAAESLWLNFVEEYEVLAQQYRAMKQTFLTTDEFHRLVVGPIAADPRVHPKWNPEARMAETVVARYERKVDELVRLWDEGAGHSGDHSAWEAYNAAAEALDHNGELWPSRGGVYRTAKLLDGDLAQKKQTVLANLVARSRGD